MALSEQQEFKWNWQHSSTISDLIQMCSMETLFSEVTSLNVSALLGIQSDRSVRTCEAEQAKQEVTGLQKPEEALSRTGSATAKSIAKMSPESAPLQRIRSAERRMTDSALSSDDNVEASRFRPVFFPASGDSTPRVLNRTRSFQFDQIDVVSQTPENDDVPSSSSAIMAVNASAVGPASTILTYLRDVLLKHDDESDRIHLIARMCETIGDRKFLKAILNLILENDDTLTWVAKSSYSHDNGKPSNPMHTIMNCKLFFFASSLPAPFILNSIAGFDKFVLASFEGYPLLSQLLNLNSTYPLF